MKKFILIAFCIVLTAFVSTYAQVQGPTLKPLLKTPFGDDPNKEVSMILVEFSPGISTGRHTHPGDEYAVVLEGTFELSVEGRETRRLSAGEVFHTPRTLVHENRNVGGSPGRVVITLILDKGKPMTQPAN